MWISQRYFTFYSLSFMQFPNRTMLTFYCTGPQTSCSYIMNAEIQRINELFRMTYTGTHYQAARPGRSQFLFAARRRKVDNEIRAHVICRWEHQTFSLASLLSIAAIILITRRRYQQPMAVSGSGCSSIVPEPFCKPRV